MGCFFGSSSTSTTTAESPTLLWQQENTVTTCCGGAWAFLPFSVGCGMPLSMATRLATSTLAASIPWAMRNGSTSCAACATLPALWSDFPFPNSFRVVHSKFFLTSLFLKHNFWTSQVSRNLLQACDSCERKVARPTAYAAPTVTHTHCTLQVPSPIYNDTDMDGCSVMRRTVRTPSPSQVPPCGQAYSARPVHPPPFATCTVAVWCAMVCGLPLVICHPSLLFLGWYQSHLLLLLSSQCPRMALEPLSCVLVL